MGFICRIRSIGQLSASLFLCVSPRGGDLTIGLWRSLLRKPIETGKKWVGREILSTITINVGHKSGAYSVRIELVKEINCTFCFEAVTLVCDFGFFGCEFFGKGLEFILYNK